MGITVSKRIMIVLLSALLLCTCPAWQMPVYADGAGELTAYSDLAEITQYGNVPLMTDGRRLLLRDLENAGIECGDIVEVSFLDRAIEMPVVREFSEAATGDMLIRIKDDAVELATDMGSFALETIADKSNFEDGSFAWTYRKGIEGPVAFRITLRTKGGLFAEGADQIRLAYTDERSDYPDLSDEEFANFRVIATTGMGENVLYRTSSPINPEHKRSSYADAALREAGVAAIMNLADSRVIAEGFEGYAESYYSTVPYIALQMGMSFDTDDFRSRLAEGLRFFAENEGPYAIHCNEGKDRTGVVAALLECFMGATYDEVKSDYMATFYNFYGIKPGDGQYHEIVENNIVKTLQILFDTDDLQDADLSGKAAEYFAKIGLSDSEMEKLRANLGTSGNTAEEIDLSLSGWQAKVVFPDWKGYTDDTLAMNSMFSFAGYHGQGTVYVLLSEEVESFRMYINGNALDVSGIAPGICRPIDISAYTKNGENTLQVSNISPSGLTDAVTVYIPYPEVLEGTPEEEGIRPEVLTLISDLIESDIEYGFTSAQLSVIRNGRLVYENAWGRTNSYLPDGTPCTDSAFVTTDTLYDLASVTKMFSVNFALQKLVTDGRVDLDAKITDFLGEEFATETIQVLTDANGEKKAPETLTDLDTIKAWKASLTIRDLLRHQGGFPADPKYNAPKLYRADIRDAGSWPDNPLFAGNGADEETRRATVEMICKTPLDYEPGTKTVYSDVDYMILGLVVEKITGEDLDVWLKKTFYETLGLRHITYNPLQNGFSPDDCAATELNGNTRDGLLNFEGYRTDTLQGEVHDEKAWYCMAGVSGHAGLFSNATDLAKLAFVMLNGGCGEHRFFSQNVMDLFTAPKSAEAANWGLGWWRQGDNQRVWYFGTQADTDTVGHQGWTGTLVMIDPDRELIVVYLTNKINSPVTDNQANANRFDGNWYTASTLGFVPQLLSIGMDSDQDLSDQLRDLTADMAAEALKLIPEGVSPDSDHPAAKNAESKRQLSELYQTGAHTDWLTEREAA